MRKRILSFQLAFAIMLSAFGTNASAGWFEDAGNAWNNFWNGVAVVAQEVVKVVVNTVEYVAKQAVTAVDNASKNTTKAIIDVAVGKAAEVGNAIQQAAGATQKALDASNKLAAELQKAKNEAERILRVVTGINLEANQTDYTKTKYPIILVHGFLGFDTIATVDYFYGIQDSLTKSGAIVNVPEVSAVNKTEVRGEQLLKILREIKAAHGFQKFNLIGHSQGGLTSRYVAGVAPDLVASVTTIGTPHMGTPIADYLAQRIYFGSVPENFNAAVNGFYSLLASLRGTTNLPQNALAALESFTDRGEDGGYKAFNKRFPDGAQTLSCNSGAELVNGVRYFSVGGTGNGFGGAGTNIFDPLDAALIITSQIPGLKSTWNDGLVTACSAKWGNDLGAYPWNHLDQINQTLGLSNTFSSYTWHALYFYRSQANRLKLLGL